MPKITDYRLLEDHNGQGLAERVREFIKKGYEPFGPILYNHCCKHAVDVENTHYYAQPMVRYGKAPK